MSATVEPVESPCVCATLRMATRAVARVYDQALEPYGLRTTEYSILARLEVEGPSPVGHLAARLAMDRTTLAREAAPLVRAGLVAEEPGEDRRQRVLALTPAGLARLEDGPPRLARGAATRPRRARLRPGPGTAGRAPGPARSDARHGPVSFAPMYASLTTVRGAGPEVSSTAAHGRGVDVRVAAGVRRLPRAPRPRRSRDRQRPHHQLLGQPGGARPQREAAAARSGNP